MKNLMLRYSVSILAMSAVVVTSYADDYQPGYNRFRPLDDTTRYTQSQRYLGSESDRPSFQYPFENRRSEPQTSAVQQPKYVFRELPNRSQAPLQPSFRPDKRWDGSGSTQPRRWTGNDVVAPPAGQYAPPPQGYSHYAPAAGYSGAPVGVPYAPQQYHYYDQNRFPWSGFMPTFSWR